MAPLLFIVLVFSFVDYQLAKKTANEALGQALADTVHDARKDWGAVLVEARNLARKELTMVSSATAVRPFVLGLVGFAATMRNHLWCQSSTIGTDGLLQEDLQTKIASARFAHAKFFSGLGSGMPSAVAIAIGN